MTADIIQERIGYLKGQIANLRQEITGFENDIVTLEEGDAEASSLAERWGNALSDCYDAVKINLLKVSTDSGFTSYYMDRFNAILSGKEAEEIESCLGSVKADAKKKVSEIEDKIKINNARIHQLQNQIDELRAVQTTGDE